MSNIQKYEKPKWIKLAEDFPKIQNATIEDIQSVVNYLTILLGSSKETTKEQIMVFVDYLKRSQSRWTIAELKEAYIMAINGDFEGIKIYNKLDATQTGRVMKAYQEFVRNNVEMKRFARNKNPEVVLSDVEKRKRTEESTQEMYELWLEGKVKETELTHFWKFLKHHHQMTVTNESKIRITKKSESLMREIAVNKSNNSKKINFESVLKEMSINTYIKSLCCLEVFKIAQREKIKNIISEQIIETEI